MQKTSHDSETAAHGQQVITAVAFITHDFDGVTKLFMPRRATTKKFLPGVFELPGGHIDYGEELVAGLKREIKEELGMNIAVSDPFAAFTYLNEVKGSHSIEVVFFAKFSDPIENISLDPDDHSEYDWFSAEDLPKIQSANKRGDDPEFIAIKRGFTLLAENQKS